MHHQRTQAYTQRIQKVLEWMQAEKIDAVVFHDTEEHRTASMRYLCGHPMDALFIIKRDGRSVLIPWDVHMAEAHASADLIVPQSEFGRDPAAALQNMLADLGPGARIELPSATPHPFVSSLQNRLCQQEIICREQGIAEHLLTLRMIKDEEETALYEKACTETDAVLDALLNNWENFTSETDAALAIEGMGRTRGAEKTGFETIVAGPARSWGIHAFPSYGPGPLQVRGLTIIDFGLVFQGYTSDITATVARGPLSGRQRDMISLVTEAHERACALLKPGTMTRDIAAAVHRFFSDHGRTMPHSLGHGIGLDIHEYPFLRDKTEGNTQLRPGMVLTIEPGLYDPEEGGVRLENDYLITPEGHRRLTNSRILSIR
ncbi:MAG: aminopeptidase P family protein [Spirochaetales bacterium]|nr:aminopeptidase P family protein [Spirochaetales bacterium]